MTMEINTKRPHTYQLSSAPCNRKLCTCFVGALACNKAPSHMQHFNNHVLKKCKQVLDTICFVLAHLDI